MFVLLIWVVVVLVCVFGYGVDVLCDVCVVVVWFDVLFV